MTFVVGWCHRCADALVVRVNHQVSGRKCMCHTLSQAYRWGHISGQRMFPCIPCAFLRRTAMVNVRVWCPALIVHVARASGPVRNEGVTGGAPNTVQFLPLSLLSIAFAAFSSHFLAAPRRGLPAQQRGSDGEGGGAPCAAPAPISAARGLQDIADNPNSRDDPLAAPADDSCPPSCPHQ